MSYFEIAVITVFLILSVAFLVVPAVVYLVRRKDEDPACEGGNRSVASRILVICAYLIGSIWCLRYAVGYFTIVSPNTEGPTLQWWEEISNSLLHALQTFSMDEDYTGYIMDGKNMLREMFGESTFWADVYGFYASALNFAAPVAGGAIVFEILVSIFPQIRLWLANRNARSEKYYFSKLNNASLALAKSVYRASRAAKYKPVIIFADANSDGEDRDLDILQEAKNLGAICMGEDLPHIKKSKKGIRKFFLIDENEIENLKTLVNLVNKRNGEYLKGQEIFFFTNDDAYVQVEKSIQDKMVSELGFTKEETPLFTPVRCYRNLISNLLVDIPLYEPLIGKKRGSDGSVDLTVTILGSGQIGREMFLSTYWFGQMLNCNLNINVISQESEEEFWGKIDCVNPEIRHTTVKNDPILRVNRKGESAPVYCGVHYQQCDVRSSDFISGMLDSTGGLLRTDYFLVVLGSDEENIAAANKVRRYMERHHLSQAESGKTVIAYVVYNTEMADTLNRTKHYGYKKGVCDVYMCAVGNLRDVYSVENVFMSEHEKQAIKSCQAYEVLQNRAHREQAYAARMKDEYNHWSDRARAMHARYKLYSMGLIDFSVFDGLDCEDPAYLNALIEACGKFSALFAADHQFVTEADREKHMALMHNMAWLEKRRWNAFIRVMGFMHTDQYDRYAVKGEKSTYKQMDIRLHPCLLECDQNGIRGKINEKCEIDQDTLLSDADEAKRDRLDDLSYNLFEKGFNQYDFKQYDYLSVDRGSVEELADTCRRKIAAAQ